MTGDESANSYHRAIEFLYDLRWFGTKLGLENTFKLAEMAGNPQDKLRFIHAAGTNGKGSTCAMLESIYRAAGLRTGLFTSPHLVAFSERIQVNRQFISEADVVRLVESMQPLLGTFPAKHHPTFFEVVTVMALQYFAERGCDVVIWETGLGGRLDSTNIVTPLASVITNIQFDHQRWLGETLDRIAAEKAGIIKPGVPTITGTDEPEALAVIQETALRQHSPLALVTPTHTQHPPLDTLRLPLLGWHQRMNAAVALATVRALQAQLPVSDAAIRQGLLTVQWPGRLQLVERQAQSGTGCQPVGSGSEFGVHPLGCGGRPDTLKRGHQTTRRLLEGLPGTAPADAGEVQGDSPATSLRPVTSEAGRMPASVATQRILLDGAHNSGGATALRAALEEHFPNAKPALILGIMQDKDWDLMCEILAPLAGRIFCTPVSSERSAAPDQLRAACLRTNPEAGATTCASLAEAIRLAAGDPFVVIAGSLYLIGEAMELLHVTAAPQKDERSLNEWTQQPVQRQVLKS